MALRTGDTVTVRRQAAIWLSQYDSIKPSVSLTRTLGDDPEAERDEMDGILYVELRRAVLMELEDRSGFDDAFTKNVTALIKHCEQAIADGPQGQSKDDFPRRKEEGGRKKRGKKVARKARKRSRP